MLKIVTSAEMREMDRHTIEDLGVPGVVLMENAGSGTFHIIQEILKDIFHPKVVLFCGKGNNGGDGFVIARHLWDAGAHVQIFIIGKEADLKGDALTNFNVAKNFGLHYHFVSQTSEIEELLDEYPDLVVDALLGTGIKGAVHGFMKDVIEYINGLECPVVAVDVPSGLNADSPAIEGEAVQADVTVTMALPKVCHVFHPARSSVGELYIADIGIPHTTRNSGEVRMQMVEKSDIHLPQRSQETHKYECGKVAVLAGSPGFTGAAALSAEAALRVGAGLVILGIPESLNPILEMKLTEVITRPYPAGETQHLVDANNPPLQDLLEWCDVLAIGPGLGRSEETQQAIVDILSSFQKPVVVDADALFALAQHPELLNKPHPNWVLTPHYGEFLRLIPGADKQQMKSDFIRLSREFAQKHGLTLLLKNAPSIVVDSAGEIFVNPTGNPGLASGGTGDVLTGLIAGLLAQRLDPVAAAYTANYLHGLCADEIAGEKTEYALAAGDLIAKLGDVLNKHFVSHE